MFSFRAYFATGLAALLVGLASSAPTDAQPAYRVKDIQTNVNVGVGLNPYGFVTSGSLVYFVGSDLVHGQEIWRTDGAGAGTFMLRDFVPGDVLSAPGSMADFGGMLFFNVGDPAVGGELWKTDGTTVGTVLVKDIYPGGSSSGPGSFTVVGATLFFTATDPVNGRELWKTDGTTAGTVLVKDVNPAGDSSPQKLTAAGGMLFFEALGSTTENRELWKSDGTAAGTVLVKDIRGGAASSFVDHLTDVSGTLFFNADNGSIGKELWKSDGTTAGTVLVRDIRVGSFSSNPKALMELNGTLLFTATTSTTGRELWTSDGTGAGTLLVKDIRPGPIGSFPANDPPRLAKVGTTAYLVAADGVNGTELWKSDGTGPGTTLVTDLCVGACSSLPNSNAAGLAQVILSEVAGMLLFSASDGTTGEELYRTDGTAPGTVLATDICPGGCTPFTSIYNYWVASLGSSLFFFADDGTNGREMWKSDGSGPGTVMVKNLTTASSLPDSLTLANGLLFFSANDGLSGDELWKSDGTDPGTTRLSDILPGSGDSSPKDLTSVGSSLFFTADDGATLLRELWKSDGTVAGTVLVRDIHPWAGWSSNPRELTDVNGTLFLVADDGSLFLGAELWKSDGTTGGTTIVKDVFPGSSSSNASWLTNVNGTLFFSANDGSTGTELWRSDGTDPGTLRVKDLSPGAASSSPLHLTNVGGTLFFVATGPSIGRELYKSDGTDAGTVLVKEICPGSCGGFTNLLQYNFLVDVNGTLFFTADDGVNGRELWKSDGTGLGTVMVADITPGTSSIRGPFSLVAQNGLLYFGADDGANGAELWQSDGTTLGTVRVTDVNPGAGTALPFATPLAGAGQEILFAATNASSGVELWKSAGSMPTTLLVQDIAPGSPASLPARFTPGLSLLFFTADDGSGEELWALPSTDVNVTKTDSSDPASTGQSFIYTLTVTNQGVNVAQAVTLTDTLPAGMTFLSSIPPTCTESSGTVRCSVLDVAPGSKRKVRIEVMPTVMGSFVNEAAAVAGQFDPFVADNETTEPTDVVASCVGAPSFTGLSSATSPGGCDVSLSWNPASGVCTGSAPIFYNVYRSTSPGFVPGPDNLVAPCSSGGAYVDPFGLEPAQSYYYVVRAEDSNFGGGGLCQNGSEDTNLVELSVVTSSICSTAPNKAPILTVTSTDTTNKLRWVNSPTGNALTIRFSDVAQPLTETDGVELVPLSAFTPNGMGGFDHTGRTNGTTYFYSAFVFNGVDTYSSATPSSGRPEDTLSAANPVEWIYSTGATALTPPSIRTGFAYAVSNDRVLHSMSSANGDWPAGWRPFQRMEAPAQGRPNVIPRPLAGASKVIFPGSQDGHVYAVDAETGSLLWRKELTIDNVQASPGGMFSAYGGAHDLVMVGTRNPSTDNVFYAVNPNTGEIAWSFDNGGGIGIINGQAAIDYPNQRVYFASYAGPATFTLWCLDFDASSVNLKWASPLSDIGGSPVLYQGRVYVGTTGGA